jgi:GNAT superfamily N-acetyltransferase
LSAPGISIALERGLAAAQVSAVLKSLPDWFGRPESIVAYAEEAERLAVVTARCAGELVGLMTLKPQTEACAEFAVMAVRPEWRRQGIGRRLSERALEHLRAGGFSLALAQTLGPSCEYAAYAETRAFYQAMGFLPLIEIADHFAQGEPGLLMVRHIDRATTITNPRKTPER